MTADDQKRAAALHALDFVEDGMALGLGTGSTANHFTRALGGRVADGLNVRCVPTSETTSRLAQSLKIPVIAMEEVTGLDLAVDGADEIDPKLNLIKGGGGALLREKIVASAARVFVVIADKSKLVRSLGAFPLPIEVVPFGISATERALLAILETHKASGGLELRYDEEGKPFRTDEGHVIFDCRFASIARPQYLAHELSTIPGVVDHGLFVDLSPRVLIGTDGAVRELTAKQ